MVGTESLLVLFVESPATRLHQGGQNFLVVAHHTKLVPAQATSDEAAVLGVDHVLIVCDDALTPASVRRLERSVGASHVTPDRL